MTRPSAPSIRRRPAPLRVLGTSVTQIEPIMAAARADLGIELDFITLDGTASQRRGALDPGSFDVYDQWFHDIDLIWPTGSIQPIDLSRIPRWGEVNDLPKKGRLAPEAKRATGGDPSQRLYVQLDATLGSAPTERVSMVPTVHNGDGFAIAAADPPPAPSWGDLLDPRWAGRVLLQSDAAIGSLDMALALAARGEIEVEDIGNLSLAEIDAFIAALKGYRAAGHFAAFWADEAEALDVMRRNAEPTIGSLWWSGVVALRALGMEVTMTTPREGYRGWFGGLALSARLDEGTRDAAFDYVNWWLDGTPGAIMARCGAYMANPQAVRARLAPHEWDFWYEGLPASRDIEDAMGRTVYRRGERREGGSYVQRMSHVAVWDTVMDEHNYLVRKWEDALAAR